jgi:hypothetical protein
VELVRPGELLTGQMKSVLKTTAGYKGNPASCSAVNGHDGLKLRPNGPDARYRMIMMLSVHAASWRRMRDLNPRGAINPNTISNRAP